MVPLFLFVVEGSSLHLHLIKNHLIFQLVFQGNLLGQSPRLDASPVISEQMSLFSKYKLGGSQPSGVALLVF